MCKIQKLISSVQKCLIELIFRCDVSDRKDVLETAKKVQREVGDVTVLINNAGIMLSHPLEEHTPEEIERTFKINVFAHYWVS